MHRLVLASTSSYRRKMLEDAGLSVQCIGSGVDEAELCSVDPVAREAVAQGDASTLAVRLAIAKAEAVARREPDAWVLGADQVVTDGRSLWGKPVDPADHAARLLRMRGHWHSLVSGFALRGPGLSTEGFETTRLLCRADLEDAEILGYVRTGEGTGCAGGYMAEARGAFLFERIEGDWFNVLGLPLLRVFEALRAHGWRFR